MPVCANPEPEIYDNDHDDKDGCDGAHEGGDHDPDHEDKFHDHDHEAKENNGDVQTCLCVQIW